MAQITISLIKELRDRTGAPLHTCKMALIDADGDINQASDALLESAQVKSAKLVGSARTGVIKVCIARNHGVILEMNCETEFAKKIPGFRGIRRQSATGCCCGTYIGR